MKNLLLQLFLCFQDKIHFTRGNTMAKKSDNATKGAARAPHRSLFYAMGYTEEELDRPLVGVCCAKNEIIPGHIELDRIAAAVKTGISMAGGTPIEFPAIGVCDGIAMGHEGMKYSLVTRELIADSIECVAKAHQFDALVLIPNCDKIDLQIPHIIADFIDAFHIGGIFLIAMRVITWHIPVAIIATVALIAACVSWFGGVPNEAISTGSFVAYELLTGGLMLGAFFMATDYVTSPMTAWGKIIFGVGIGVIMMVIRLLGNYPEGMSFAILIMNACVPLLNKFRPQRFGEKRK